MNKPKNIENIEKLINLVGDEMSNRYPLHLTELKTGDIKIGDELIVSRPIAIAICEELSIISRC